MSSDDVRPGFDEASYREYERKMIQFEEGPTTTYFEQLKTAGIELPKPDAVADCEIRTKLWEVLAGMAALRVRLDHTDHLSDRALRTPTTTCRHTKIRRTIATRSCRAPAMKSPKH